MEFVDKNSFLSFEQIVQKVSSIKENKTNLVLIGGCSRAGKSSLASKLQTFLLSQGTKSQILSLDHWIVDIDERMPDSKILNRYRGDQIISSISQLLQGKTIVLPSYNKITRKTDLNKNRQHFQLNCPLLLVEGVVALAYAELRKLAQCSIYVEIEDDVRKQRFYELYINIKSLSRFEADQIFFDRENEEVPFIKETKLHAHFIYKS